MRRRISPTPASPGAGYLQTRYSRDVDSQSPLSDHAGHAQQAARDAAQAHERVSQHLEDSQHAKWSSLKRAHAERAQAIRSYAQQTEPAPQDLPEPAPLIAQTPSWALEAALEAADGLPAGEAGVSRPALNLRIGIICDPFLFDTFHDAATLVPITPQNWRDHHEGLDLLLVAATWRGHDGTSWDATAPHALAHRKLLRETIIPACQRAGIPTVYYGKEDPPDYRLFLDLAQACEHIVTTAAESVPDYRRDCPRAQSVAVLPFGVNPLLHSPLGSRPAQSDLVFFAGSWMGKKYPQRARFAEWILDGVVAAGRQLAVIDRYWSSENPSPNQAVPEKYWPYRVPAVNHHRLMGLNRVCDIAVNLNSVLGSQTMFANRALELQASGTFVISSYNQGLNSYFPQVKIANSARDVEDTLRCLGHEELRRAQADGIRSVFMQHHVVDLLARVARQAGCSAVSAPERERTVAVTQRTSPELEQDIAAQSVGDIELLTWDELRDRAGPRGWGEAGPPDILLPVDPARRYEPDYAADHTAAFRFQAASLSVKLDGDASTADPHALRHAAGLDAVGPAGGEIALTAWWRPDLAELDTPEKLVASAAHERIFVGDHLQHRPAARAISPSATGHASAPHEPASTTTTTPMARELTMARPWEGDSIESLAGRAREIARRLSLDLSVIVPIYNNGSHLRHKAFASLRRSPDFARAHILLVDDGSTDPVTLNVLRELDAAHPNVTVFRHATGGSGSASRPRNTGLELAATDFVTYLDPDDEEFENAYRRMTDQLEQHPDADFSLGTQITWTDRYMELPIHQWYSAIPLNEGLRRPGPGALRDIAFRPASIEGIVARTAWLRSLGLTQPVGATGQDTFFFQQMIAGARAYAEYSAPAYVYYGAVDHSIVNVVSARYFRKYLILEEARSEWLRESGLLQDYLDTRFEHFFVTWYLWKLTRVSPAGRAESEALLVHLASYYCRDPYSYPWRTPEAKRFFGQRGLPRPTAMRPMLGRVRRRVTTRLKRAAQDAKRTRAGRAAGTLYRRSLKPQPQAAQEWAARLTAETRQLEPLRAAAAQAETRLRETISGGTRPLRDHAGTATSREPR